ncbi:hypothetical protein [Paenibacillus barengoltzii]|uniref:Glycosyl hydrolase family 32 N-terminal domain-containing protein n=2 Tax=Paenibacillus barengoltzii TaxID=343517 RepID=R9L6T7_9BACL|nr:hypothetical protein C812_03513 [Paenibacillus barengoltzii G22]SMF19920.1 Beta-fructosidases (levanase/invertase) [Paenibacillus barengoltzii J12]
MTVGKPIYHFTPPANWMNDPNGLIYYEGVIRERKACGSVPTQRLPTA